MHYSAKICRVVGPSSVDMLVQLGFGVSIRRRVWMKGVPAVENDELRKKAIHCLVVLIGGKNVNVEISDTEQYRVEGVIMRDLDTDKTGAFEGMLAGERNAVNVNAVMCTLRECNFDVNNVKTRLIDGKMPA